MTDDLDKSGRGFQRARTYLGPTIGWVDEQVQPSTPVTGTYTIQPGDSLLLVDSTSAVTINLPDVKNWIRQAANQPATGFTRVLTIKDFGGHAGMANITIAPFGTQTIDKAGGPIFITTPNGVFGLAPLVDLSGWTVVTGAGGPPPPPPAILSSPTAVATGLTTAALGVTTDTSGGTLFWVVEPSLVPPPTAAQIRAGQDGNGAPAAASGSQVVTTVGVQTASATGLTTPIVYTAHFVQVIASTSSNVVSSAMFDTVFRAFGSAADRVNMLHPTQTDVVNPTGTLFGVQVEQSADNINQWVRGGSVANGNNFVTLGALAIAPDGTNTAQKIVESNVNGTHHLAAGFWQNVNTSLTTSIDSRNIATKYRLSVFVKAAERTRIALGFTDSSFNQAGSTAFPSPNGSQAVFDLAGGTVAVANTAFGGVSFIAAGQSITVFPNGWYRCTIDTIIGPFNNITGPNGGAIIRAFLYLDAGSGSAPANISYAGNGTSGVLTWRSSCLPTIAWDLNRRLFFDDFLNTSTIDVNDTRQPGYLWYISSLADFGDHTLTAGLRLGLDYDVTASFLNIHVLPDNTTSPWTATVVWDGVTSFGYIGTTYTLPCLTEARGFPDPRPAFPTGSQPIFWADSAGGIFAPIGSQWPGIQMIERDFAEWGATNTPLCTIGKWNTPPPPYPNNSQGVYFQNPAVSATGNPPPNYNVAHTYSNLVWPQAPGFPPFGSGQRNIIPNSSFSGAVPGTPGTLPTRMQFVTGGVAGAIPPGISTQVVSLSSGVLQLRFFGTTTAGFNMLFEFNCAPHNNSGGTMAPGQIWTGSVTYRVAAGNDPVAGPPNLALTEYNAADVSYNTTLMSNPARNNTTATRYSITYRPDATTFARLSFAAQIIANPGETIDVTYEFFQPQLELSFAATPFQASAGADVTGALGISVTDCEPFFGRDFAFFDTKHASCMAYSSVAGLDAKSHFFAGSFETDPQALLLGNSGSNWPSHWDWVSVFTR